MRNVTLRKVVMGLATVASLGVLTACSYTNPVARSYYLDRNCDVYYVDQYGNHVTDGKYGRDDLTGLTLMQGSDGRWFYQDAWGNRIYKSRWCK